MEKKKIGAGILAIDTSSGKILLGRRSLDSAQPNIWSNFGGAYDKKDGHPKETAKREFEEETGINVSYKISTTPIYTYNDNNLIFYTYAGLFDYQFPIKLCDENLGYGWFDFDNLPENLMPAVKIMFDDIKDEIKNLINKHKKKIQ